MLDHAHLVALLTVERERSFIRAADRLGLSKSAVSQRVRLLEQRVGTVLVRRTRPVEMTGSGSRMCRYAETVEQMESDLLRSFSIRAMENASDVAKLRVLVDADSLATWFLDVLEEEAATDDPRLFDLSVADQDLSLAAMREGHALTAISSHSEPVQGYRSRTLGTQVYLAVASPAFIERHLADGTSLASLRMAPCICRSVHDSLHNQWMSEVFGETVGVPTHVVSCVQTGLQACRSGAGWFMAPVRLAEPLLDGELVPLEPRTYLRKRLYWHVGLMAEETLRSLSRRVIAAAQACLEQAARPDSEAGTSRPFA